MKEHENRKPNQLRDALVFWL